MDLYDSGESFIGEYLGSERFLLLDDGHKDLRESVLHAFFRELSHAGASSLSEVNGKKVAEVLLEKMPHLALDAGLKKKVPDFLEEFFGFLSESGRYPAAGAWRMAVEAQRSPYLSRLRDDGSVRGETFKKNYTDVGRNDPCPCGSGQKFKKCCMPLIR